MAWKDLSIAQRSQLMNLYRQAGITSLSEMRQNYDLFSLPSKEESPIIGRPMAPIYAGGGNKEPYFGEITQRKKWNTFDTWMAKNPQVGHGLRKAGVLLNDAMRLIPGVKVRDTIISPRSMTDFGDIVDNRQDSTVDKVNSNLVAPLAAFAKTPGTQAIVKAAKEVFTGSKWPTRASNFMDNIGLTDKLINAAQFIDDFATPVDQFANGGKIHIKKKNRGKFNATKKRTGKTTEELTHSKNPLTRKRAIFAQNARKWKHEHGGIKF